MLLPISHEKMTVRRLPIVTVAIIVVTVLLHAVTSVGGAGREERAISAMLAARLLYLQHPALGVCAPLKPFVANVPVPPPASRSGGPLPGGPLSGGLRERLPSLDGSEGAEKAERAEHAERNEDAEKRDAAERYEGACKDLAEAFDGLPSQRFGYVPARANLLGLFTYMFVHADWWHVIGNMWFLFLCGLALEDRWGRLAFAAYYVVGGIVAAGVHHLMTGDSAAALIGASGAVAAAMGAFLVLFATTKIRFVGFLAFRVFSFAAPAYVMLPMWALVEIAYGAIASSSGTAHWAHVGGFVFGAAVAGGFRVAGVDRRLDDAVERAAVLGNDPRVDAARALVAKGEAEQAVALLEGLAKEKPESIHVWEALRDVALTNGDAEVADHAARQMAAIEAVRSGRPSTSISSVPPRSSASSTRAASISRSPVSAGSTPSMRVARPSGILQSGARESASAIPGAIPPVEAAPFFPPPPPRK